MTGDVWAVLAFLIGTAIAVAGGLVNEEIRGWLDQIPHAILRLAARKLSPSQRTAFFEDEWIPELTHILVGAESRPITRLIVGIRYALGILVSARRITRDLHRPASAYAHRTAQYPLPAESSLLVAGGDAAEARPRLDKVMSQIEKQERHLLNHEDDLGSTTNPEAVKAINAERERIMKELKVLYAVKRQTEALQGSRG